MHREGSGYTVEVSIKLLPRLLAEVTAGKRAGREAGGLLIGSFPKAPTTTLRIEDFMLFDQRTVSDGRFNLNTEQRARLSTMRHSLIEQERPVLGFFRSHARKEALLLSQEDRELLTTEFRRAIYVALLIRTESPNKAVVFIPDEDGKLPARGSKVYQFEVEDLALAAAAFLPGSVAASSLPASAPAEVAKLPPAASEHTGFAKTLPWGLATGALAAMCLVLTVIGLYTASSAVTERALHLEVQPHGSLLELHWNRAQPDLPRAEGAVLTVIDGGVPRRWTLTPYELRAGIIAYQRRSEHVVSKLSVRLPESVELIQSVEWKAR